MIKSHTQQNKERQQAFNLENIKRKFFFGQYSTCVKFTSLSFLYCPINNNPFFMTIPNIHLDN
ncbi:unnamed protein product [Paramecium pentaurelia]|uniref:Uncharacterized protein n=1 Tax=Paramecium pentaurelia TaxID=43138 RepID=A0A8S1UC57_9CILI|nr:unnamed protein product [Paramecium pentaurelia]